MYRRVVDISAVPAVFTIILLSGAIPLLGSKPDRQSLSSSLSHVTNDRIIDAALSLSSENRP